MRPEQVARGRIPAGRWGAWLVILLLSAGQARAADEEASRLYRDKATAAFSQHDYATAAEAFEKAFALTPEPPLLYNAAQTHRLAGHRERALALYQEYARTYGKTEPRPEVEARIEELTQAIAVDSAAAAAASTPPAPKPAAPAPETGPDRAAPVVPELVARPSEAGARPLVKRPWFWGAVGGGVAVAVIVALVVVLGGATDPVPSLGKIDGY